ncbi:GPR1/FUN34/yaaH family-domain-containing protein [Umbelopsis sp. PMI_123]|nr:GPR1/FUN34/yaaH family-domain-containing protein [Umbelopsis sp. PMI_123]
MSTHSTDKNEVHHHESITMPESQYDGQVRVHNRHITNEPNPKTQPFDPIANPAPLGLAAFATSSLIIGLVNTGVLVNFPSMAVGITLGYGAIGQLIAGLAEMRLGNTFGATSFISYSCFFFSYGIMLQPASGFFAAAEAGGIQTTEWAIGLFQLPWTIFSLLMFIGTLRQPVIIRLILAQVFLTFFFGTLGGFCMNEALTKTGGWFSVTLAITAWYGMAAMLYTPENTFFTLPIGAPKED